ncbi:MULTISPECIES: bifunctional phosphopantothenoylcysteine decarboxylase/phosphopantothenate--cysteine ligase CoaBC [Nitrospirillum]|uniref:bifunctional phosphopantothenoylcysteine decarboxylase/phosphopantothenate--cysteine ligase CoaBC n=1 Tax=Nitrospirillum amazonense TaxID=28077 RepID=UPI0011A5EE77|nr:bifunctional phosphopantothenoylcysteine decarboxylase/phosphopantothenate--cysteine ligase CoaBC [Nitrospirillum amazonense]MEC4593006.1 bifunctional phosphopantothenoylcysteine decarboxylase/phosphopantothenate--cysteine ligase CoaBC [Nitrospirillum amazonense]
MTSDYRVLEGKRLLLVISGGIAAYKCLELIRRLKERGVRVRAVLTEGAQQFVTPLSVAALSEEKVYTDLFSLTDESEMGHIRLSREADLVVVAPASADILARMAAGMANDLATTALLATDKPVLVVPAMNVMMWTNPATQANVRTLEGRGIRRLGPAAGDMACGEVGSGRMVEPMEIVAGIAAFFAERQGPKPLTGRRAVVTSGPTHEPIDPVRYIANRSSGKQGHAVAAALAALGADVTLVSGPVTLADPPGVRVVRVETAAEMLAASQSALQTPDGPADIAVCAAAVADWRVAATAGDKVKKGPDGPPTLTLAENPDILATLSQPGPARPRLVVGFAAETRDVLTYAAAKLAKKGCDWIVANDVATGTGTFGGDDNQVHLLRRGAEPEAPLIETWPRLSKTEVAVRLAQAIADTLSTLSPHIALSTSNNSPEPV